GSDALIDLRGKPRIDKDCHLRLAEHVNEARCNDFARRIYSALACHGGEIRDGCDFAVANANVAGVPRRSSAVDDVAVRDNNVKARGLGLQIQATQRNSKGRQQDGSNYFYHLAPLITVADSSLV